MVKVCTQLLHMRKAALIAAIRATSCAIRSRAGRPTQINLQYKLSQGCYSIQCSSRLALLLLDFPKHPLESRFIDNVDHDGQPSQDRLVIRRTHLHHAGVLFTADLQLSYPLAVLRILDPVVVDLPEHPVRPSRLALLLAGIVVVRVAVKFVRGRKVQLAFFESAEGLAGFLGRFELVVLPQLGERPRTYTLADLVDAQAVDSVIEIAEEDAEVRVKDRAVALDRRLAIRTVGR